MSTLTYLKAEAAVTLIGQSNGANTEIFLHNGGTFFSISLSIQQLIARNVEPSTIPRLETFGGSLEEVPLSVSLIKVGHRRMAILHCLLQSCTI